MKKRVLLVVTLAVLLMIPLASAHYESTYKTFLVSTDHPLSPSTAAGSFETFWDGNDGWCIFHIFVDDWLWTTTSIAFDSDVSIQGYTIEIYEGWLEGITYSGNWIYIVWVGSATDVDVDELQIRINIGGATRNTVTTSYDVVVHDRDLYPGGVSGSFTTTHTPHDGGGGGCPYVSTWNGTHYVLDNNLIPAAEYSNGSDVIDYYKLQQPLTKVNGGYSLLIWDLDKHSFLDQIQLVAVDHEFDIEVGVSPSGEILTFKEPAPPTTAFNRDGNDISDLLNAPDGQYYQGYAGDYIQLDFSGTDIQDGAKLVITSDFCPIPPCFIAKSPIYVQILNSTQAWQTVATVYPRFYWSTDIIDLSEHLLDASGELKVRVSFTSKDKIDHIGLDTTEQEEFEVRYANLAKATHSTHGDVKEALMNNDDQYAELLPSEQVTLKFTIPQNPEEIRDYIIIVEGHYYDYE